jgi:hypothetical protein
MVTSTMRVRNKARNVVLTRMATVEPAHSQPYDEPYGCNGCAGYDVAKFVVRYTFLTPQA